jgi:hypothetical protein
MNTLPNDIARCNGSGSDAEGWRDDSDRGFLMWIHERLEHVHGENHLMDYMHKLRAIIADMPADRKTVSVGQGKNSLESLQEFIVENA